MGKGKIRHTNTHKVTERYFSKIRSRKIEKCLLQLQDALKNNEMENNYTTSIEVPLCVDYETSNSCYTMNNTREMFQYNAYNNTTESLFLDSSNASQAVVCFDRSATDLAMDTSRLDNHIWCGQLDSEKAQTQSDLSMNKAINFEKILDPDLCLYYLQDSCWQNCGANQNTCVEPHDNCLESLNNNGTTSDMQFIENELLIYETNAINPFY